MIGTSRAEYIFIRIAIFCLQYTTPLCLVGFVALSTLYGSFHAALSTALGRFLLLYAIADLFFALLIFYPYKKRFSLEVQKQDDESASSSSNLSTRARREALFHRCLTHNPDPVRYIRLWFLGAELSEIRRDNVREFLLWAFFDSRPGQETADEAEELDEYVVRVEAWLGRPLASGRGSAQSLRLTFDAIEACYRSFGWYVIVGLVDIVTHVLFAWHGFEYFAQPRSSLLSILPLRVQNMFAKQRSASPELGYWYRPHTASNKLPVVFLHGIGIGLLTYIPFLAGLDGPRGTDDDEGQVGIIAIEILPISFRLTTAPPLARPAFLRQLSAILDSHPGFDGRGPGRTGIALAAHSYGTALATHALQSPTLGPRIESTVLIDPVSICLHLPDVAYNFTRRRPRHANEWQLWYFASTDPGVALCLGRHFFWKESIAWKEDLLIPPSPSSSSSSSPTGVLSRAPSGHATPPAAAGGYGGTTAAGSRTPPRRKRRVAVCLAERDLIVDTLAVGQYLADGDEWLLSSMEDGRGAGGGSGSSSVPSYPATLDAYNGDDDAAAVAAASTTNTTSQTGPTATSAPVAKGNNGIGGGFITRDGVELLWFPGLDHAQVFDSKDDLQRLCGLMRRYCAVPAP